MRHFSYSFLFLVSGLYLTLLVPTSFGSDRITQEELQEKIQTAATTPLTAIPFSPEYSLPHDIKVYILSFLMEQKDLLRTGAVSKSWRKAAEKVWEKRWFDLSNKPLTPADYKALARGIFQHLKLNQVGLDEEEMNILATCSQLQVLELDGNNLRATEALIKLLSLSHLSHVNLASNQIKDKGAIALAPALKASTSLTTVNLYGNKISNEGVQAIAEALKENQSLTSIDLNCNPIGDEGAKAMAEAIKQNSSLTQVNLGGNGIGVEGAKDLADAIKQSPSLTQIDLYWNNIGTEGAKAIAEAMKENKSFTSVELRCNCIDDEGATAVAEAIKQNQTLTQVDLSRNNIGEECKRALEDLKRSRPSLKLKY